ncbi:ribosome maturation factor RimM [Natranaerobius thermophilus]|uniref:Ribosome maturation factor RimM n=1 Tax=Natranaerobius thermophilus (strain ATCC BAA-1301 / DSM 18059 / JW/NM-WN-LF) TaxID=457570 RepID=RIMM_NATTJ|nr:ribosome maturation factor RimM [Natranaerobius thermophilus]B2A2N9.1 RecName: Full=Ribosome maturation factor RimM [Natranaerobius thermophilus JW/NM-WN-LF]ACB84954.1 16S rRNA processing protein RimM [Natranaerobius thermophilus JW/NM-WN-LF]
MHPELDLVYVGKIVGTHGVKGELKVISLTDIENRFNELDRVYLVNEQDHYDPIIAHIESSFTHKNMEIVKFSEWDDINQVEGFHDWYIKIPREERPQLEEDEYYFDQITGLSVVTVEDEFLGTVTNIYQTGSNDVYEVSKEQDDKPILIPALYEVVKKIDLDEQIMIVDLPEGLLDEEE